MTPQVNPDEGARPPELRGEAREAPGKSPLGAVLDALDQAIAVTGPGDRPGLMVALAARLAQLGVGLAVSSTNVSGGPNPRQQEEPQEEGERWITPEQAAEARCLTPEHAAELLDLPRSKVYDLLRARRLPGFKEGKHWLLPVAALKKHVRSQLDNRMYRLSSPSHGGQGAACDPGSPEADPGSNVGAPRRDRQHCSAVGARRGRHQ
jgi:excisionase family DNA binding protein